ncbi:MAG TPA: alanyl-tRNA editing protein [Anaerolineales bacterium]|nr:alanyl-tRNA editing protein [Anaerolineales bacterium]
MTSLIYLTHAYEREFDATVVESTDTTVALDRTVFYPGGGGQPSDKGELHTAGGIRRVMAVHKAEGHLWHELDGPAPKTGERVRGTLDWERRHQLMRTHTAMHILCGVIWRDYAASVTGGNMEPLRGRMDFEFATMRQELVHEIEEKINREVSAARPIHVKVLPREEAFRIPDLIRTKINLLPEGIQDVRIVEIEGLDLQADGGTHVANTRDVGLIRVVDYKSKGAINKRIVVALEP